MSIYQSVIPHDEFDQMKDKIAVMLKSFTIKRSTGFRDTKYSEPYFIFIAIPESGNSNFEKIEILAKSHPKTRKKVKNEMLGDGYQIYGPANPGEYLAFSVLVMESDEDVRKSGETLDTLVKSNFSKVLKKVIAGVGTPASAAAVTVADALVKELATLMTKDKDDSLFYITGSLLRDVMGKDSIPYQIQTVINRSNEYVDLEIQVLPVAGDAKIRKKSRTVKL
jgi:hypothetical protein